MSSLVFAASVALDEGDALTDGVALSEDAFGDPELPQLLKSKAVASAATATAPCRRDRATPKGR